MLQTIKQSKMKKVFEKEVLKAQKLAVPLSHKMSWRDQHG